MAGLIALHWWSVGASGSARTAEMLMIENALDHRFSTSTMESCRISRVRLRHAHKREQRNYTCIDHPSVISYTLHNLGCLVNWDGGGEFRSRSGKKERSPQARHREEER
ncbi:hypothetical protein BKA82DRAFT_435279 [Pisolithus tinctorius]|uniref:Secreted protein n=1 Tax=Pisolithus tinctorius Marx 270 TaxID=870435 RepID=A0A0C3P0H0_PISTI|nr:hypothetical protein BKA82DRAFT_435279 [Pisolithus tinctorius]KIO06585.1 hypothetical protein M404DRAFT_435279 [Pisolithus tinctorius Marx 270]